MHYKKSKITTLMLFILAQLFIPDFAIAASMPKLDERQVLITYYGEDDTTSANIDFLEATLSGLFENVKVIKLEELFEEDIKSKDIVVFYSAREIEDNIAQLEILHHFNGNLLGIGIGATILQQFNDWTVLGKTTIRSVDQYELSIPKEIVNMQVKKGAEVIVSGQKFDREYPVIIKDRKESFITLDDFYYEEKYAITTALYDLFNLPKPSTHYAYIRIEDISPAADPKLVLETGNFLLDQGIPVYLAVIPVYVNNKTGSTITLEDVPELVDVLDQLIQKGAYVIAHGYTHTYRYSETGEGFEFWDSVLNQPITTLNTEEQPEIVKKKEDFSNINEYDQYISSIREVETVYIEGKLENSIHLLTRLGFPPIAFEAPHYTMSSNGYKVTSNYFSAIFGQIQMSDTDWHKMGGPLLVSKPSILNGMTLYPETIGFVDTTVADPIGEMEKAIDNVTQVPGAMLGGFYHPYLGIGYLKEMVALLKDVPNLEWLELNETEQFVKTDLVKINYLDNGEIQIENGLTWQHDLKEYIYNKPFEVSLWVIVFVTAIFVAIFTFYIMTFRIRHRKRLFEER